FATEVTEAREHYIEGLEQRLDDMATDEKKPNVLAMIFRLKALRPEVYRERYEVKSSPAEKAERERRIAELLAKRDERVRAQVRAEFEANGKGRLGAQNGQA